MAKNKRVKNPAMIGLSAWIIIAIALGGGIGYLAYTKGDDYDAFFTTDLGSVYDHSFNQQAWEGTRDGANELGLDATYITPKGAGAADYEAAYNAGIDRGANMIALAGFVHEQAVKSNSQKNPDVRYIWIDDSGQTTSYSNLDVAYSAMPAGYSNIMSVKFVAQETGYLTGLLAAAYTDAVYPEGEKTVATWGGMPFGSVFDFMSGYLAGVHVYNTMAYPEGSSEVYPGTLEYVTEDGQSKAPGVDIAAGLGGAYNKPGSYFTGGFEPGRGAEIAAVEAQQGAKVLFPVAGPQTQDAINQSVNTGDASESVEGVQQIKVIGVDTDARATFSAPEGVILSSSIKQIKKPIMTAMAISYNPENNDFSHLWSMDTTYAEGAGTLDNINIFKDQDYGYNTSTDPEGELITNTYYGPQLSGSGADLTGVIQTTSATLEGDAIKVPVYDNNFDGVAEVPANYNPLEYWGTGYKTNIFFDVDNNGALDPNEQLLKTETGYTLGTVGVDGENVILSAGVDYATPDTVVVDEYITTAKSDASQAGPGTEAGTKPVLALELGSSEEAIKTAIDTWILEMYNTQIAEFENGLPANIVQADTWAVPGDFVIGKDGFWHL